MVNSSYSPEHVLRDLLYLRKADGFTATRFQRTSALRAVLGGDRDPLAVLQERFESAISSLRDADAAILMQVYGLAMETSGLPSLQRRRDCAAKHLGIGRDAVADRDAAAVKRLHYQILTGWYPKSPVSIRIPESHNGIVNHHVHVRTLVRNGRHVESLHHYRFFCTFEGAEYLALTTAPDVPVTEIGNEFRLTSETAESGVIHRFSRSPMDRGRVYDLRFRITNPDPDELGWLTEESLAFHEPTRFASFDAVFVGDRPTLIWQFSGLTAYERPGQPSLARRLATDGSRVSAGFRDLYGGLFAGIAWEW